LGKFFGTDGVRGVFGSELTIDFALKIGQAAAFVLSRPGEKILIGCDTRISSSSLVSAIAAGICSAGVESILLETAVPTPAVAFLTKYTACSAGAMISASHNSFEFNGIKFFDRNGFKLNDETEKKIENLILEDFKNCKFPSFDNVGRIHFKNNLFEHYIEYISNVVTCNKKIKIAFDCANGSSYCCADKIFGKKLNSEFISCSPNGININQNCGSTDLKNIKKLVIRKKIDIGIAFDGDADRCIAVDENGETIDGDEILAICALDMFENDNLSKKTVVGTDMTNMGLTDFLKKLGINFVRTNVGDRYILDEMNKNNFSLGGEQSGHIIFLNNSTTGDGLLTAAMLINVITKRNIKASEIKKIFVKYPQITYNIKFEPYQKILENPNFKDMISKIETILSDLGRVFVRKSGTEPLVRIMCESKYSEKLAEAEKIIKTFKDSCEV
jgi:phosphoglucosamine mutase